METVRICGDGSAGSIDAVVLRSFRERLRGLLGTDGRAGAVLLAGCSSIHTFGMAYPLDLAFIDGTSKVIATRRNLVPGRIASCRKAVLALERPASEGWWPREGDRLFIGNG